MYSKPYLGRISEPWHKTQAMPNQNEFFNVNWVSISPEDPWSGQGFESAHS